MRAYSYSGLQKGKKIKGQTKAPSLVQAKQQLREKGINNLMLKEVRIKQKTALDAELTWGPFGSIPAKEIVIFTKKISTMMRAGLPIVEAMGLVSAQTSNKNMQRVTGQMMDKLNGGSSLSQAFREHPRHFDKVYLNMVEAGEISGKLDVFLDRLVEMLEKQQAIRAGI